MNALKAKKLSDLIEPALQDLISCERSSRYEVDMDGGWHWPDYDKCMVCLGGAVMARQLGTPFDEFALPKNFPEAVGRKLLALDYLRLGDVCESWARLKGGFPAYRTKCRLWALDRHITPYEKSPKKFKQDMRQLADDLRAAGF